MAPATTIRGGKVRIMLGAGTSPIVYSAPCGFTSRSITFSKGLEESNVPDCDNPDKIDWIGRDATSLSIAVSGEGVLAVESVDTWDSAWLNLASVPARIEIEFPAKTIIWTGNLHIESLEIGATNGTRTTLNVSMQSDGEFTRAVLTGAAPNNTIAPTITGNPKVGVALTASPGTWTGDATITYAYQWKVNGVNVGTNTNTYTPVTGDIGKTVTCTITATNSTGSKTMTAGPTTPVIA